MPLRQDRDRRDRWVQDAGGAEALERGLGCEIPFYLTTQDSRSVSVDDLFLAPGTVSGPAIRPNQRSAYAGASNFLPITVISVVRTRPDLRLQVFQRIRSHT